MHTQYIVTSRNLDNKLSVTLWSMGPPVKVISLMFSFISFCVFLHVDHVDTNLYDRLILNASFIFEISVHNQSERDPYEKQQIKIILTK